MEPMHNPPDAIVDIVFVHGLQGDKIKTWTWKGPAAAGAPAKTVQAGPAEEVEAIGEVDPQSQTRKRFFWRKDKAKEGGSEVEVFWPRDLLVEDCPKARILTWGYNSKVTSFLGTANQDNIFTHASNLLNALKRWRMDCRKRSLIFVAHSLGGIIVKDVILQAWDKRDGREQDKEFYDIYSSMKVILFLGTPHRGSTWKEFGNMLRRIASVSGFDTAKQNLQALEIDNAALENCHKRFVDVYERQEFEVRSFAEARAMVGTSLFKLNKLIVPRASASLGGTRDRLQTIDANHINMCKFPNKQSDGYQIVSGEIKDFVNKVEQERKAEVDRQKNKTELLRQREKKLRAEENEVCLRSLWYQGMYPLKSSSGHDSRSPQTCEWLLDHPEYSAWTLEPQGLLWVRGKPGSGKSTLMNFAVESSKKQPRGFLVAAFFFHGQAKELSLRRSMLGLLRSLLHQLLKQSTSLCAKFHAAYRSKGRQEGLEREPPERCDWQLAELRDFFLEEVANAQDVPAIRIFVDAMDESRRDGNGEEASEDIVKFLELLSSGVGRCPIGVCASSRHYLVTQPSHGRQIRMEDSNTKDISLHVQMELQNCQDIPPGLREEIVTASANIFLWARLVTRQVVILYKRTLNRGIITRLVRETLLKSKTLDDVFKNILCNLQEAESSQTIHLMRFVCFAERPLSSRELWSALNFVEAMSLSPEEVSETLDTTETIEFLSGGLVEFQKQDEKYVAQFIHQTVKEFLEQEGFKILDVSIPPAKVVGNAHRDLSINCAKYLSNEAVHNRRAYRSPEELLSDFPFLNYAIHSVFIHAEAADVKGSLEREEAQEFLTLFKRDESYSFWVPMYRMLYPYSSRCPESDSTFLHMVSAYNISNCARLLLADLNGSSIDVRDNLKRTALHWAASEGNDPILNLLLENRPPADIEAKDKYERTPLHMACYAGRKDMVEKLLLSGAYIEQQEISGWRPLHRAVDGGHESVVKLLLEKNADIEAKDSSGYNALLRAAKWDHGSILRLLLEKGANIKAAANSGETALHAAASRGNETNVRHLLGSGAEVDAKMEDGKTPLFFAAEKGWVDVTRYLLSKSANAKATMPRGETPLHFAASFGHFQVADLLLQSGADVTARAVYGGTPLHAAAYGGYKKTVALLLRSGADVSAKMDDGETPLDEAGENGSIKRMLKNWTNTGYL